MAGEITRPGYVNAHTHLYSGLAPMGMPAPRVAPRSFIEILERVWWRLDRALDADSLRASARLYVAEALLKGTTALIDHHESPGFIEGSLDVLADACEELGIRAALCFGATERNGGRAEARRGLQECRRFCRARHGRRVRGLVGLHASFTVSDDTVREAGELCQELGTVIHVHVAEDVADVEDARRRGYPGPLERLRNLGALPEGSVLAHGVHLTEAQVRGASQRGCWLVQNPRSNAGNGVGYPRALSASRRVALGTDGYPADMPVELDALVRQALELEPGTPTPEVARRLDAGRTLISQLFPNSEGPAAGEVVVRRLDSGGEAVERVTIDDQVVVIGGRLLTGDIDEIRVQAREEAARLWHRMEAL
ncbi:MAG: amidohydrolase family protein [Candidatus Eisenbacteria bacterium]|nr:amidohydrolase family protein [Candidatus Eisenbacteria bacterium]